MSAAKPYERSIDGRAKSRIKSRFAGGPWVRWEIWPKVGAQIGGRGLCSPHRETHEVRADNVARVWVLGIGGDIAAIEDVPIRWQLVVKHRWKQKIAIVLKNQDSSFSLREQSQVTFERAVRTGATEWPGIFKRESVKELYASVSLQAYLGELILHLRPPILSVGQVDDPNALK